jgi:basic membrane lipoprotein Med (substrate-binding protein (PBP1-ABC) superfamily)
MNTITVRRAVAVLAVATATLLAGCTPTARTAGSYTAKAVTTAEAVHNAIGSDLLLLVAVQRGHTTAAYVSIATSDAEDDASSASSTYLSIQPPDHESGQLRDELSDLLEEANRVLATARIAGRRGERAALLATKSDLTRIDEKLTAFADGHQ